MLAEHRNNRDPLACFYIEKFLLWCVLRLGVWICKSRASESLVVWRSIALDYMFQLHATLKAGADVGARTALGIGAASVKLHLSDFSTCCCRCCCRLEITFGSEKCHTIRWCARVGYYLTKYVNADNWQMQSERLSISLQISACKLHFVKAFLWLLLTKHKDKSLYSRFNEKLLTISFDSRLSICRLSHRTVRHARFAKESLSLSVAMWKLKFKCMIGFVECLLWMASACRIVLWHLKPFLCTSEANEFMNLIVQ